jgi:hypothetical protein
MSALLAWDKGTAFPCREKQALFPLVVKVLLYFSRNKVSITSLFDKMNAANAIETSQATG